MGGPHGVRRHSLFAAGVTALALSSGLRIHRLAPVVAFAFLSWVAITLVFGTTVNSGKILVPAILAALITFAVSGAARAEAFIRREWRQKLKLAEQEQQLATQQALASSMQAIAERMCDLVIFLDAQLSVVSNTVPVSAFFGRAMIGNAFCDVVSPSDRQRLEEAFGRAAGSQVPQCLPVSVVEHGTAHLLIASTGAASPKYLVGLSVEATEDRQPAACGAIRDDLADALAQRPPHEPSIASMDRQTTRTERVFRSSDLEQIAELGREEGWWIDPSDVRLPTPWLVLGEGGFGVVAMASYRGQAVAVKVNRCGESKLQGALGELRVLRRFRHPNVVLLHGAMNAGQGSIALVTELVCGMQLCELLQSRRHVADEDRFQILYSISSALSCLHLHSPSIVHGDLKPQNIMMEEMQSGFRPKLLDFGFSFQGRNTGLQGGTMAWQAPETFGARSSARTPSDVFSFGWLAIFVVSGDMPHSGLSGCALRERVRDMVRRQQSPHVSLPPSAPFRSECQALAAACLFFDPEKRPRTPELLVSLGGWVSEEAFCRLGVGPSARALRQVDWQTGSGPLFEPGGSLGAGEAKVHFVVSDGFRTTRADGGSSALALPSVGGCLCDWLDDPVGFRVLVRATLAEVQRGARGVPLHQTLLSVWWRPPGLPAQQVSLRMLFPSTSGLVKLRMRLRPPAADVRLEPKLSI